MKHLHISSSLGIHTTRSLLFGVESSETGRSTAVPFWTNHNTALNIETISNCRENRIQGSYGSKRRHYDVNWDDQAVDEKQRRMRLSPHSTQMKDLNGTICRLHLPTELMFDIGMKPIHRAVCYLSHWQDLHIMLHRVHLAKIHPGHGIQLLVRPCRLDLQWLFAHFRFVLLHCRI